MNRKPRIFENPVISKQISVLRQLCTFRQAIFANKESTARYQYLTQGSPRHGKKFLVAMMIGLSAIIAGCSDDDDDNDNTITPEIMAGFDITVTNLSAGQPLSPTAMVLHNSSWQSFSTGQPASVALEELAEGGDNSAYLAEADAAAAVYASASGTGPIAPGGHETVNLRVSDDKVGTLNFSVVSMLVNTNDALAAVNNKSIADLAIGDRMSFNGLSYDSGTEANSETADTMPGPAAAGGAQEGFTGQRDDVRDAIYVHPGVITAGDGLSSSALSAIHRWDHPAIRVTVERVE